MTRKLLTAVLMFTSCLLLTGCFVPEDLTVDIVINKDGSYVLSFAGELAFIPALEQLRDKHAMSKEMEQQFTRDGANMIKKAQGFDEVTYKGNGRFAVRGKRTGQQGERNTFPWSDFAYVKIRPQQNGSILIETATVKSTDLKELERLDTKINVTLSVSVPKGAQVIDHNADSKPKLFGLIGSYTWHITAPEQSSFITVKP